MSTAIKYFSSAFSDAPVLNGTAGSLIDLLDACLVNGYGLRSVNTLLVSDGVATATVSTGHPYPVGGVVLISGATPAEINGEKRVLSATANTFTFAAPGVADGGASGTISAKMAPAGWTKPFSGTNLAAYRNQGNSKYLRVNDTAGDRAEVRGFGEMTDVNTGVSPFPTPAQLSGGIIWKKSQSSDAVAREWRLVADDRLLHLFCLWNPSSVFKGGGWYVFGDLNSFLPGDSGATFVMGYWANPTYNYQNNHFTRAYFQQNGKYLAVDMAQMINSIPASNAFVCFSNDYTGIRFGPTYPGAIDGGAHLFGPIPCFENHGSSGYDTGQRLRGLFPGAYQLLHNAAMPGVFSETGNILGLDGRRILIAPVAYPDSQDHGVPVAVDITGPWR